VDLSPAEFIPIAEESGLTVPIGNGFCALPALKIRFGRQMDCPVKMAVNLSARQFKQQNLVEMVAQVLKETRLDAIYLELELTESLVMENVQQAIAILQQLHDMGITLSLDDFGTGYSSLNYLETFSHPCT